ncbi:post-GPI attachment to proteins factor 2-like [Rhodnius prolixus]|uniref:Putative fgf receptor activating protein 1 n=1 Tax=Rhodnius prolixus TaxID=13249 RepID=R4G7W9_RHOPR
METEIRFQLSLRKLSLVTVLLPLVALVVCFVSAYTFQQNEIHETHCRVYNVIPSISAITGISPERYIWRISIALHVGPRILIASLYYYYYLSLAHNVFPANKFPDLPQLISFLYWLNIIEISALMGVTYISNQDNYPIHEKIFITFMVSSLVYMLISIIVYHWTHPSMSSVQRLSYRIKATFFITSLICTVGLIIFFMKHRLYCHDLAFSWFALCEYIIASANMGFHVTVFLDFPDNYLLIMKKTLTIDAAAAKNE